MSENMSYMYTPHAFNLIFLKNHLKFWTEIFRAIFLNIRHTRGKFRQNLRWSPGDFFENCATWAGMNL